MTPMIKKLFEKYMKNNNKTFLSASNIVLASLIVVLTILLNFVSSLESDCNNEVQVMLINKTQQYVEAQEILLDMAIDASNRAAQITLQNQQGIVSYTTRITQGAEEYKNVTDSLKKEYDSAIETKKDDCSSLNIWKNIVFLLLVLFAVIQLSISIKYFNRYLNDKS